jgi:penicillin-binding protein 1A
MVEAGAATRGEIAHAKAEPLELRRRQDAEQVKAAYFAEEVRRELLARYGEKVLYGAGLSVHTSLDARLQAAADNALRTGLIRYERSHGGWRGPVARIDPKGDWTGHLAKVSVPAVAADQPI